MRGRLRALIVCLALLLAGCGDDPVALNEARITVWVHVGDMPVAGVPAEVLGTELSGATAADGKVHFTVAPGEYTVRVHYNSTEFDHHVIVRRGDEAIIDSDFR